MVVRHPLITFTPFLFNNKVYQPAKHPASYQKGDSSNDQAQQCWPKCDTFPTLRQYLCGFVADIRVIHGTGAAAIHKNTAIHSAMLLRLFFLFSSIIIIIVYCYILPLSLFYTTSHLLSPVVSSGNDLSCCEHHK